MHQLVKKKKNSDDDDDDDDDDNNNNTISYFRKNSQTLLRFHLSSYTESSCSELPQFNVASLPLHWPHNPVSSAKAIKQQRRR